MKRKLKMEHYNIDLIPVFKDMLAADTLRADVSDLVASKYGTALGDRVMEILKTINDKELLSITIPTNRMTAEDAE